MERGAGFVFRVPRSFDLFGELEIKPFNDAATHDRAAVALRRRIFPLCDGPQNRFIKTAVSGLDDPRIDDGPIRRHVELHENNPLCGA